MVVLTDCARWVFALPKGDQEPARRIQTIIVGIVRSVAIRLVVKLARAALHGGLRGYLPSRIWRL